MPLPLEAFPAAKIQLFFDTTKKNIQPRGFPSRGRKGRVLHLIAPAAP